MNCDTSAEKSIGYCYNIAQKSDAEQLAIQLDLRASQAVHQLRKNEITRRHIEVMLYDEPEATRDYLRERLNYYRGLETQR